VPDTYTLLKANPDYYRAGEPKLGELKFNVVPEASTRAAGMRTGTYQLLPTVDPVTAQTLRGTSGVSMLSTQDLAYSLLGLNVSREPFTDPRVREAINLAINRDDIVQAVYLGNAVPGGPLSPALKDWAAPVSEFSCYQPDAAKAKQLLADAGYPNGFDTEIITFGTIKEVADLAQVLQAQLAEVGIRAKVNVEEFGKFVQDWRNSEFDMFVSLNGGNIDPDGYLNRTFHTGGSTNVFKFSDPVVDTLLDQGRTTVDMSQRQAIYDNLQKRLACTGPIVHVAYGTLFSAVSDRVDGFQQMATRGLLYLRETSLK
jgi:peptide/nickel transport system substrate-binding protein